jgi:hypothetical protein
MSISSISNSSTLLDMLNNSGTSATDDIFSTLVENNNLRCQSRLEQLGITSSSSTSTSDAYEKVSASATNVTEAVSTLTDEELWNEDSEGYSRDNIDSAVKSFVSAYNTFLSNMSGVGNSIEKTFKSNLDELVEGYADELAETGITVGSDGKLTIDDEKLKNTETSKLKELFGTGSEWLADVSTYAGDCGSIISKALAVQNSMSSLYNSSSDTVDVSSYLYGSAFDTIG